MILLNIFNPPEVPLMFGFKLFVDTFVSFPEKGGNYHIDL